MNEMPQVYSEEELAKFLNEEGLGVLRIGGLTEEHDWNEISKARFMVSLEQNMHGCIGEMRELQDRLYELATTHDTILELEQTGSFRFLFEEDQFGNIRYEAIEKGKVGFLP